MAKKDKQEVEPKKDSPSDIAIGTIEDDKKNQGDVTIELDDRGEVVKPPVKEEKKPPVEEYVRKDELEKERRRIAYEVRRAADEDIRKMKAELDAVKLERSRATQPTAPVTEWDKKVQENWKGTVEELADLRAEKKFNELMEKQEVARVQREEYNKAVKLMNDNKEQVLKRHPELMDETSEKAQILRRVVEMNPAYGSNPYGPVLAMRDMEDELRGRGIVIDEPTKHIVDKEVARQTRTNATSVRAGAAASGNKIVLTKEERDLCDHNGWKYESYAASKAQLSKSREFEA